MKQMEMGAEINAKCSQMLTRKEKSKETVLFLKNVLAIDNKKMKETIKAFLKKFVSLSVLKAYIRTKLFLHFSLCSLLIFGFSNLEKTFAIF